VTWRAEEGERVTWEQSQRAEDRGEAGGGGLGGKGLWSDVTAQFKNPCLVLHMASQNKTLTIRQTRHNRKCLCVIVCNQG